MATIESAVESIYGSNCVSVVITTILVYDYFLTIGQEVEYVWQRSMSLMSFLYYVVRYLGLLVGIITALWGNIIRGSVPICAEFFLLGEVGFIVIIWASAVIMVLRVFAMYNQSKIIFGVLLLFFIPTVAAMIAMITKFLNISSVKSSVIAFDLLGTNYCAQVSFSGAQSLLLIYLTIPRICFDVLLVVLTVGRLVKDAVNHRVPGKWQPNVYLRMLVRDSIMYFILNLMFTLVGLLQPVTTSLTLYQYMGMAFNNTVPFMLAPHLVISFRYHTKADAIHSGFASDLGASLGTGEQEMCFARPAPTSSMDERGV